MLNAKKRVRACARQFRHKEIKMRENEIEKYLVRRVRENGGFAPKWTSGERGVPDRIVILPNGKTVYVELKAPGKKSSPLQVKWFDRLEGLGHKCYLIDSKAGVDDFIHEVFVNGV